MRILHLVQCGPTTGGTVSHVATQVTHQIQLGLDVGVVAASDGVLTEHCREAGAQVFVDTSLAALAPGEWALPTLLETGTAFAPVHLVPNGVEVPRGTGLELAPSVGPRLLYCGRLSPEKGPDSAILGFHQLLREFPDATLHVIGTGPDETLLRRMVAGLGIIERVFFYESISQALAADLAVDVLLAPSRADAASLVILEAMAARIPIVTTPVGGNPELIRNDVDAILIEQDSPQAIAAAASRILTDSELATKLTNSAYNRYTERFTAHQMALQTVEVYKRVLSQVNGLSAHPGSTHHHR